MPYDSNGIFTLNAGYLAVAGQVIQPSQHNPPLEDIVGAGLSNVVVRDGRAAMTGNLKMGTNKITGMADGTLVTDGVTKGQLGILSSKSLNYTAVAADFGAYLRFTASATLSLTAASTLGANWRVTIIADGGTVTIDPNGAETINGQATLVIPTGGVVTLICDGSNFFGIFQANGPGLILLQSIDLTGAASTAGAFLNLNASSYDQYLVKVLDAIPATGAVDIYLENSTNNGSSYGATSDVNWRRSQQTTASTTIAGVQASADTKAILANNLSNTANLAGFCSDITWFPSTGARNRAIWSLTGHTGTQEFGGEGSAFYAAATNAIRIRPSSGNWTSGRLNLYGLRH